MEFKKDTDVFTVSDEQVGQVDRVVIDPHTKELTHVVVRKGWFFTQDKVVPIEMIARATEDKVILRPDLSDLETLPDFEEIHYIAIDEAELGRTSRPASSASPVYWYPPALPLAAYPGYTIPPYVIETEQHIPEGTVALKEGAKVVAADGDHVGNIEELVTGPGTDRVTHVVISQGLLLRERKLVPSTWIETVEEDEVHLAVRSGTIDSLRPYEH
jgi:uncharacterized protein YrrD